MSRSFLAEHIRKDGGSLKGKWQDSLLYVG